MGNALAVITGATKGIGKACAKNLWDKGYSLAICARNAQDLAAMTTEFSATAENQVMLTQVCDVSVQAEVAAFAKTIADRFDFVDVLINNAGAFIPGKLIAEEDGVLDKLMQTNLMSAYWLTRGLLTKLQAAPRAHIVNMCSIASLAAYPPGGSYAVSKFALRGLSTVLRDELKETNVSVTAVFPGATWSASWEGVDIPQERLIKASDIASAIGSLFELSPQAVVEELLIRPQLGDL